MKPHMKLAAAGLMALGLTGSFSLAAGAQDVDDDGPVVEESYMGDPAAPAAYDDDSDAGFGSADAMQRCAETFRSFDPSTGTYVTYGGETRTCPYLG